MIVGNVEEYIDRCLTSFAPIADEIIVVRAIGSLEPDKTLDIARDKFSAKVFEYKNAKGHEDWPHVDSFAAARQMSFDMATGEYCFWCDTDDILLSGAELIREHAERGGYPVFVFPYEIFGRGVVVPRERMILREAKGKWLYPVHECFAFDMHVEGVTDERVVVQHLPHSTKTGSTERNLRIIESIPDDKLTAGLLYHLHCEQLGSGKKAKAIESAKRALAMPTIGTPEKYELLLNLAKLCENQEVARQYLHLAYSADPKRREALGMLACSSIDAGRGDDALAFARQMIATERPGDWSWNDRGAAYGWIGFEIYQQALRAAGKKEEAEVVRQGLLRQARQPVISLIHASRGRAVMASKARKMWFDLAEDPESIEHIFCIDADDRESDALTRFHHVVSEGGGCVAAWNKGALACNGQIIIQMSDDWMPPPMWDTLIRKRLGDLREQKVLAVSDGHRTDNLLCMAIMTRTRWLFQTYIGKDFSGPVMFHPDFTGVYSDNWFSYCAYRDGVVIEAKELVFTHNHPAFSDKVEVDQTYAEQNAEARYLAGRLVMEKLIAEEKTAKPMQWQDIKGWFDFADFYGPIASQIPLTGTVVEVGVFMGQSFCFLAHALQARGFTGRMIAVDTFKGEQGQPAHEKIISELGSLRPTFEANMASANVSHETIEGDSVEAAQQVADESCDFVFVDAAHEYEPVIADLAAWWPKVKKGGIIAGHDYPHAPVAKAVHKFFKGLVPTIKGRCWMIKK